MRTSIGAWPGTCSSPMSGHPGEWREGDVRVRAEIGQALARLLRAASASASAVVPSGLPVAARSGHDVVVAAIGVIQQRATRLLSCAGGGPS